MRRQRLVVLTSLAIAAGLGYAYVNGASKQPPQDGVFRRVVDLERGTGTPDSPTGQRRADDPLAPTLAGARVVEWHGDSTLAELVKPGEASVELVKVSSSETWQAPKVASQEIDQLAAVANAVVLGRVLDIQGDLTDSADWINSTLRVQVAEVIKNKTTMRIAVGQDLMLPLSGGDYRLTSGTLFRARHAGEVMPQRGHDYIYILTEHKGRLWPSPPKMTYDVTNQAARRQSTREHGGLDEAGMDSADLLQAFRVAAARSVR